MIVFKELKLAYYSTGMEYGWLSKSWSLFGYPKYQVPYYNRDPKRDHNFDNHPYVIVQGLGGFPYNGNFISVP